MFMIQGQTVNKEVEMIKSTLDNTANAKLQIATGSDKKDTSTKQKYLTPPIKPLLASYYFDKNLMLARSCNILAEDLILGNVININIKDESDENEESTDIDISNIINSIEKSQLEISYMCGDYELTGAGCCKILKFEEQDEFRLIQLPMESLQVIKVVDEKLQSTPIYLIEQSMGITDKTYYKIVGETYPEEYISYDGKELGLAWWIGGDNFYKFFKKPVWLQSIESMNSQIALESLDTEKINSGNNVNGVLFFNKQGALPISTFPQTTEGETEDTDPTYAQLKAIAEMSGAQTIASELKSAGIGTAVLYEETRDAMSMNYVKISDDNYSYLQDKAKGADQKIISSFGIPRERYMINDIKESMNSQKTAAFWEIYTKSLNAKQLIYEDGLLEVISECYPTLEHELDIDIEVPMFSELVNAKISVFTDLFMKGLITLKQTIILLSKYVSDLNVEDYDFSNPIYDMRFFQGKPLDDYGLTGELTPEQQEEYDSATGLMPVTESTDGGNPVLSPQSID
ncbi:MULTISPECIES: hypothetical protein [Methanobacterium]|uniref:Portal protein n=1 Tax=Methanobacterium bryantii TaxID=2161 RepID=A0A2A2H8V5_METBR|nr:MULTISPECIES: hypothetical protein [Methanobacterium]OEC87879.1 hypothetical protein A9507_06805 [Methanobacterium sp. A39]PAV05746.1 hypothetical protein ASJ80_08415 [Methanobacterium bryantii]